MKLTKEQLIKAEKCLPEANIDSPPFIQVPVPDDRPPYSMSPDKLPEKKTAIFHSIEFQKVIFQIRDLDGHVIEHGYKYILNED